MRRRSRRRPDEVRGRLKPHDPFELIRWLAFSQPDPRKALAELVQNSLDAGARTIRVTRRRERGVPCLFVFDDGEGVIPELDRADALRYIATHIGHSRKRALSPQERLQLLTQGQYGIGLLGFWSLGERLEMRSAVPGQRPSRLILHRDRADYRIEPLRGRLCIDEQWTEVVIVGVHREAQQALGGRRAADFLASELRGQLLSREVELVVEDRMARGRSRKVLPVSPPRFLGERVDGLGPIEVPGYPPIRLEIHLAGERDGNGDTDGPGLAVYSAGTLVGESFHDLAVLGLDRSPWTDPRLTGIVDFPGFRIAPGSRRGVVADAAAGAFARSLAAIESVLAGILDASERRRRETLDRMLIRDLQRAFRDFSRHRPRYALLPVPAEPDTDPEDEPGAVLAGAGHGDGVGDGGAPAPPRARVAGALDLLPPGPLVSVRLSPPAVRVACRGTRRVRAQALDATGCEIDAAVRWAWSVTPGIGTVSVEPDEPARARFVAGTGEAMGELAVVARTADGGEARARIDVEVLAAIPADRGSVGVPEPELVHHPSSGWRSRMHDGRWQVNAAHRDYRAVAERPALRLRYLALLLAKEVVLRSHHDPRLERPLEQLVEVAAYADVELGRRGRGGTAGRRAEP